MNKLSKLNYCYAKFSKITIYCAPVETKMSIKLKSVAQKNGKVAVRILKI